nr:hypothetical protein CFP56_25268 [Quercus suber]
MTPYYSFASYLRSSIYDALVLQVRTMLQSLQRCDRGFDMYNDLKFTLEAPGRGERSGGSRGVRRRGGGRAGPRCATEPEPIYEEGDEPSAEVEESWLQGDWVFSDGGTEPSHTADDAVGPSHTLSCGGSQEYEAPRQSPRMLPQCSVDPPMVVDAYLSPHQACPPHLLCMRSLAWDLHLQRPTKRLYRLSRYWVRTFSQWRVCKDLDALLRTLPIAGPVTVSSSSTLPIVFS